MFYRVLWPHTRRSLDNGSYEPHPHSHPVQPTFPAASPGEWAGFATQQSCQGTARKCKSLRMQGKRQARTVSDACTALPDHVHAPLQRTVSVSHRFVPPQSFGASGALALSDDHVQEEKKKGTKRKARFAKLWAESLHIPRQACRFLFCVRRGYSKGKAPSMAVRHRKGFSMSFMLWVWAGADY